jgi:hypothetical protein
MQILPIFLLLCGMDLINGIGFIASLLGIYSFLKNDSNIIFSGVDFLMEFRSLLMP